ncbi:NIPSNAP family protein [Pleomorphovibrio marinus]|uniref:NIPSNAP family protein n=1 Tax=Pleomorphovibrio marinus TaxID=2164132 RepID=UPI000E0BDC55|nr:NIPSNAP family protein [Pleomorphovibrio marinus]
MKIQILPMLLGLCVFCTVHLQAQSGKRELYELKTYHIKNADQEKMLDEYLQQAYIPAANRQGIQKVGVFKPRSTEEDAGKMVYVFTPFKNQKAYFEFEGKLQKDNNYQEKGKSYIHAAHDNPPYERIETALLLAFSGMPAFKESKVSGPKKDRVYELRSYEAATERLYRQKVKMFNQGEIDIFDKLDFNHVFYAETLAGANMPNLMYMTTFENMDTRNEKWKQFGADPDWEAMKDLEEYKNTVSKNDTRLLYPADYSQL